MPTIDVNQAEIQAEKARLAAQGIRTTTVVADARYDPKTNTLYRTLELVRGSAVHDSPNTPRTVTAAITGVATGLLGGAVPIVGLTGGIIMELLAPTNPQLQRFEHITEGVMDGSAALLGRILFRGR